MPPKKRFITSEICENRASRSNDEKRIFMARFLLDKARAMWRSVTVVPCETYLQPATAFEIISLLGERGYLQFVDINSGSPNNRSYTIDINRCVELEKKLEYFEYEMLKERDKVTITHPEVDPKPIQPNEMSSFENMIEKWENDIIENTENLSDLKTDLIELKEITKILNDIGPMLDGSESDMDEILAKFQDGYDAMSHGTLYIMTGVIDRYKSFQCQKMLWIISRGNIHYRQADNDLILEDPATGRETRKVAFMAVCQGEALRSRMEKVCAAFNATIYPCSRSSEERADMLSKIENRIMELESVLVKTKYYRCMALRSVGKQWRVWVIQVRKTKAIYLNMNYMVLDLPKNCLLGRCWIAEINIVQVQKTMDTRTEALGVRIPSVITKVPLTKVVIPPTIQMTNKVTHAYQVLCNTYGDARYKEINPAVFMIIGLPFLFAVMFSDMGHATIITMIAMWMIIREKELLEQRRRDNELWDIFFGGRYMLLLMGIWSLYSGFCFNQVFAQSINLSANNSMYKNNYGENVLKSASGSLYLDSYSRLNKQYIWGTDPMWTLAKNKIAMKSSQMMKLSIIIGTLHILFGLLISAWNHNYFKNKFAIYLQFLPQLFFMLCLFGWTVLLIYWKWYFYNDSHSDRHKTLECAPLILPHFLARFIPMEIKISTGCSYYFFKLQPVIEIILNLIIIMSIFVLLFGAPLYIHLFNLKTKRHLHHEMKVYRERHMKGCMLACKNPCGALCDEACRKQEQKWQAMMDRHSTPFSQLMSNQLIFTIEFVLGTVSHVASYLRLWALGMGHYIIADMLWAMILRLTLQIFAKGGEWILIIAFAVFAILTFIVLIVMEGLCCFFHALRLHWVEFMSKFYIDEGTPFRPFHFKNISSEMGVRSTDTRFIKYGDRPRKKGKAMTPQKIDSVIDIDRQPKERHYPCNLAMKYNRFAYILTMEPDRRDLNNTYIAVTRTKLKRK